MKIHRFAFLLILLALAVAGFSGCTKKISANAFPRAGWGSMMSVKDNKIDPAITSDYEAYIAALPPEERQSAEAMDNIMVSEDGKGQLAIIIEIQKSGDYWQHILIYDASHKRIEATKCISGHYMS